jgi:hypothetical protein
MAIAIMDYQKFLENLKNASRTFALNDQYIQSEVLDSIIRNLEDALDESEQQPYISEDNELPF